MTKEQAIQMARDNFAEAIDQAYAFDSLENAFDNYFDNMRDTLTDHKVTDVAVIRAAEYAFELARKNYKPTV